MHNHTVLIADDDRFIRDDLKDLLSEGYDLLFAATAAETIQIAATERPDLILLDLKFPDCQDLSVLQRIKRDFPETEVIMLTSQTEDVSQVVAAIKMGAFDYIGKPFSSVELLNRVAKSLELRTLSRTQKRMLAELTSSSGIENIVGSSAANKSIHENIRRLAVVDGCVLIRGESGTGKELVARAIHYLSKRARSPFIAVNCASIPESLLESVLFGHRKGAFTGAVDAGKGKFEAAEDGTIFLDEIGDMPVSQQSALLRVLEYRTFTPVGEHKEKVCRARFLFATNRDLRERVQDGSFRSDLYYRINVGGLMLPTLRSRPDDIVELVEYYNLKLSLELGRKPVRIHPTVIALFMEYDWPGNVRELKNVLEGAMMLLRPDQQELTMQDLPAELLVGHCKGVDSHDPKTTREREDLIRALKQCQGNQSQAAKLLGVHRNTIRTKIRSLGLIDIVSEN